MGRFYIFILRESCLGCLCPRGTRKRRESQDGGRQNEVQRRRSRNSRKTTKKTRKVSSFKTKLTHLINFLIFHVFLSWICVFKCQKFDLIRFGRFARLVDEQELAVQERKEIAYLKKRGQKREVICVFYSFLLTFLGKDPGIVKLQDQPQEPHQKKK